MLVDTSFKICWNPCYQVKTLDDGLGIFFYSELSKSVLKGRVYCMLAPYIMTGEFSSDELVEVVKEEIEPEIVYYALTELEKKKLIQQNCALLPPELATFCGIIGVSEQEAFERLMHTKIYVNGDSFLLTLLVEQKIQLVEELDKADFAIFCTHDYLELDFLSLDIPFLLCKPFGCEIWVGPLFEPGRKGCYQCLVNRLKFNRLEEKNIERQLELKSFTSTLAMLPSTRHFAWSFIASEIFKRIVLGKNEQLEGKIQTFNSINLEKKEHCLIRYPNCSICNQENRNKIPKIEFIRRETKEGSGGYRSLSPEETIKKYEHLVSPIIGVVKYLESQSQPAGSPIHVSMSGSNWSIPGIEDYEDLSSFRNNCSGKGTTEIAAKAGGLCESLERISGCYYGDEPVIVASYQELGEDAIHPHNVTLYSEDQFKKREKLNRSGHAFWTIPHPFCETAQLSWTPLYSLTEQKVKYYPTTCCYFLFPKEDGKWACGADSNGCAAGNNLEEAVLQGFLELVERDAVAIWWYNRIQCPSLDLASFQDHYIDNLLHEYLKHNRVVWVLDITTDLGIPSFVALACDKDSGKNIYFAFGSHLDVKIAVLRALTELNQFVCQERFWEKEYFREGKRELKNKKVVSEWMTNTRLKEHAHLKAGSPVKTLPDYPKWKDTDILESLNICQQIVKEREMEMLVLDQTRSEIGLNVARVIVPGLRHFWPRFAPGRLFDVPVEMGYLEKPLAEDQLNPIGMFL